MRRRWKLVALILPVFIGGGLPEQRFRKASGFARSKLAETLGEQRFLEPRLTGGFSYAPCRPTQRPGRLLPSVLCSPFPRSGTSLRRQLASNIRGIQEIAVAERGVAALHVSGVSILV